MPLLAATRIVLIHPSLPENVGAVARGMRHFGLIDLVLVGGVAPTHSLAVAAAAGADSVLASARVVDTLDEALADTVLALGTTARPQDGIGRRAILPAAAARLAAAHAPGGKVALVFGTEKDGMRVAELRRCHQIVTIPGTEHACLNLAQAFTILAYEWRLAGVPAPGTVPALAAVPGLDAAIADALTAANMLKPHEREAKLHTLRRVLSTLALAPDEAAMLMGLARGYAGQKHKPTSANP
ncbi:MAG: tRNA ((32)/uridine(32)-2-O)-methyltransferase TrmJ [Cyanobacteria bacterium RYN_339]|nr:tRNA ((32)/uridine(32)-2-O)-methyltransferase TrmJ [Cyanobacteria bacterium RYN_339]